MGSADYLMNLFAGKELTKEQRKEMNEDLKAAEAEIRVIEAEEKEISEEK